MRYRGGGVGHIYMRAIEIWLTETGWGSSDALASANEDAEQEEGDEDESEDSEANAKGGDSEDEVQEGDVVSNGVMSSDEEYNLDADPDIELSSENDEETLDGKYGFSAL